MHTERKNGHLKLRTDLQTFKEVDSLNLNNASPQGRMNEPPNMISTKDLSYLSDALAWELLAVKKCHQFSTMCTDPDIQQSLDRISQMHQQHYGRLLKCLQSSPDQNFVQ
jgi:hypothetical protein